MHEELKSGELVFRGVTDMHFKEDDVAVDTNSRADVAVVPSSSIAQSQLSLTGHESWHTLVIDELLQMRLSIAVDLRKKLDASNVG
jgi:hypothetical protein